MRRSFVIGALFLAAFGGLLVACGDDDGSGVRGCGSGSASGGSASGGSASGGSASGGSASGGSGSADCEEEAEEASGAATGTAECAPVGEELEAEADETVEIELLDYAFAPGEIEVSEGIVTFATTNAGTENHELAFLPGGGEVPFIEDGVPDEDALASAGAFELEGYGPGESCDATYEMGPGEYTIFCIVPAEDGETHYEKGMQGTVTVS